MLGSGMQASPVMTFPIKKRINTELFIDRMAALYVVDGRIKNVVRAVNHCYWLIHKINIPCAKSIKRCENEKPSSILFWNDFHGSVNDSDGSGSKIFDLGQVGSIFCDLGPVRLAQPFKVWVWIRKISPKNFKFFNFFHFRSKKISSFRSKASRPLIYCGSKVSLGRVKAHL